DEGIELVTDQKKDAEVEGRHADKQAEIYNIDLDHSLKVLSMQEDDTEVVAAMKEKGKGILIEAPKPMKKKDQIEIDAEYARKLQEEINKEHEETYKNIDWNAALDHVQSKEPHQEKKWKRKMKRLSKASMRHQHRR
nr:hypothetical protein [Tanacetum cinerariifolium]